ncbi:uncharacterized protein PADG_00416 [Paracoccidioides brasiliensis Pb18]|uniref:Uncharacterized protein n=1 Tax=Paracoccidioides brasiliensis (strain Pb18) TaxID=502780 RepID=C1G0M6_PARBD|nr:uncharacterized protein PADG_00416 [Paracoccidioides brasiliensis Pb18]EEH44127.1 hypothetical protein PADG_00416 [Paracoccidioides brasiliensis Pb18]
MESPLSVLTPSRRNARPPCSPSANTPSHKTCSPASKDKGLDNFSSTTPMKTSLYNEENVRLSTYNDSPAPSDAKSGNENALSGLEEGPESSPFHPTVFNDQTPVFGQAESGDFRLDRPQEEKLDSRELTNDLEVKREEDSHRDEVPPTTKEDSVDDNYNNNTQNSFSGGSRETYRLGNEASLLNTPASENNYDEVSNITMNDKNDESMSTIYQVASNDPGRISYNGRGNDHQAPGDQDDTCLSAFSAVPDLDMTGFAQLRRNSPIKRMREASISPRKNMRMARYTHDTLETPNTVEKRELFSEQDKGTPAPGQTCPRGDDHMNIIDFTDQPNSYSRASYVLHNGYMSPSRRNSRFSPSKSTASGFRSPSKFSLLDLDIPPAPTPRSIPSITPRELESLKSSFLSEISSLKATLSGREAEVKCLKESVADAERRVGEVSEELRNESSRRQNELQEWERRGKEMETVLRGVRSEIVDGERERERLNRKIEEAEKCKEKLESRVVELESQFSAARNTANTSPPTGTENKSAEETAREVQDAVERVARELHTLYKGKHETKVAALKKSYEARWEKRVREAERKLKEALEENARLKAEKDSDIPGEGGFCGEATFIRETESLEADKRVLEARVKGLEQELVSVKRDSEILRSELKQERTEKGELVAAVDEWLAIQQHQHQQHQHQDDQQQVEKERVPEGQEQPEQYQPKRKLPEPPASHRRSLSEDEQTTHCDTGIEKPVQPLNENFASSSNIGRLPPSSAIRPRAAALPTGVPTPRVPRFGMPPSNSRGNNGSRKSISSGLPTSGGMPASTAGRSGIMSSIERMGRGGGGV